MIYCRSWIRNSKMKRCEDSFVVVCGIVRNAEKGLRRNLPIIDKVLTKFKDFCVFIYENDSTDGTKKILQDWQSKNEGRVYVSLNQTDPTKTIPSAKNVLFLLTVLLTQNHPL